MACRILVSWPGIEPMSPALEGVFFMSGPPGKSQEFLRVPRKVYHQVLTYVYAQLYEIMPNCFHSGFQIRTDLCFISLLHVCMLSCFSRILLLVTLWTVACQAPLSMGFSKQEYWNGLPFPSPRDLPDPGIEPALHRFLELAVGFFNSSTTWETRHKFIGSCHTPGGKTAY